jgi:hypothetical protein
MFVCGYSVLSCVSSGLAAGWSPVQEVLPIVYKCKIKEPRKRRPRPDMSCKHHWMDGWMDEWNVSLCVIYQLNFTVFMYATRISRYV